MRYEIKYLDGSTEYVKGGSIEHEEGITSFRWWYDDGSSEVIFTTPQSLYKYIKKVEQSKNTDIPDYDKELFKILAERIVDNPEDYRKIIISRRNL